MAQKKSTNKTSWNSIETQVKQRINESTYIYIYIKGKGVLPSIDLPRPIRSSATSGMLSINPAGAASDGRTGIPPVSCLTLTNGSPPINPHHLSPPLHPQEEGVAFEAPRTNAISSLRNSRVANPPSLPPSLAQMRLSSHLEFFSRFKIVSELFLSPFLSFPRRIGIRTRAPARVFAN